MILFVKRRVLLFYITIFLLAALIPALAGQMENRGEVPVLLPVIMYHEVKTFGLGKDVITPEEFLQDLTYLKENRFSTVTVGQVADYVEKGVPLPYNPIMLTFDDGYLNNYHYVFPLLQEFNMKIVLSLIGKNTDDFTKYPDSSLDYSHVTWAQLKELTDSGLVEVQNHTYDLHRYDQHGIRFLKRKNESKSQYEKRLKEDLLPFQDQLFSKLGVRPIALTYPYGVFSGETDRALKELGFTVTLSCRYGINRLVRDPACLFGLKRIARSHQNSLEKVLTEARKSRL